MAERARTDGMTGTRVVALVLAALLGLASMAPLPGAEGARAYMGVVIADCQPAAGGEPRLCITSVVEGGAASRAGARVGDVLLSLNGVPATNFASLTPRLQALRVDKPAALEVLREGQAQNLDIRFEERDSGPPQAAAGAPRIAPPMPMNLDPCEATRAGESALNPYLPFRKLSPDMPAAEVAALLDGRNQSIRLQGDVLTLAQRAQAGEVMLIGMKCAMDRVGDANLLVLRLTNPRWNEVFLTANFLVAGTPVSSELSFRGAVAPPAPARASPLRGSIARTSVPSALLPEPRDVTVYLPPGDRQAALSVLFMTDGQAVAQFAAVAEPLIVSGRVAPFAIVGEHSGVYAGDLSKPFDPALDVRMREYVDGIDPQRFAQHMQFFTTELVPWAHRQYGLSTDRNRQALMGYSNGGAFVLSLGLQHPELFGTVLPFSPASRPFQADDALPAEPQSLPRFLFAGGELEPSFNAVAASRSKWLQSKGAATDYRSYVTGHDPALWQQALADYLPSVFPPR